ncbi:glutathione S-transferase N-terminal domain-containing protein [Xinfangfangia sp. CPCC 101601]|uniref:Glutathione S-transferase N-terminal domain-containing protein n=1 Tax=Pseudogemmobacter lacusdianii TaxID=3069608 RepID=A0ABU0VWC1_9RHOB|nr:glutathione S-transferase N-terminal domain-containing protein [Xinfangfangia sp. CPCC 101601]MDQ2066047.1 glutathione S-transferase N-terminal domain-containing protein [Xinfangfangia sp. CPCC 101601]
MAATELLLYATPISVYSCKLRIALALKGLEWRELPPPGGYCSAEYKAIVPQGTVPALRYGDALVVESDTIIEYLDDLGLGIPLVGTDPASRARNRALSRLIDLRIEPALRALFPLVGSGAVVPAAARDTILRHLETLQKLTGPGPFLSGNTSGLPDCGLCAVGLVQESLNEALQLGLPDPHCAQAYEALPALAPHIQTYRRALQDWVRSKESPR